MVEEARLESVYTPKAYRGFESRFLRHQERLNIHSGPFSLRSTTRRQAQGPNFDSTNKVAIKREQNKFICFAEREQLHEMRSIE